MWSRCSPWLAVLLFFQENLDKQKDLSGSDDSLAENTKVRLLRGTCLMVLTVFLLLFFCLSQWLQRHLTIVKFKKRCNIENLTEETLFQEKGGALTGIFKKSLKRSESPPSEEVSCALLVFISWYPLSRENEPCCVKLLKKPLQSCHWSSLLLQPLLRRRPTLSAQIVKLWRARRWHFLSHHFRARMRSSSSLKEITLCLIWLFVSGKRGDI